MFYLFTAMILGYVCARAGSHGGGSALRRGFFIVVLIGPTWMTYQLRSIRLDYRVLIAFFGITALFAFAPKKPIVFRPMISDFFMGMMFTGVCVSQYLCGAMAPLTAFDLAAQWLSTYVMGRVFLQSQEDIDDMVPVICWMFFIVFVLNTIEALAMKNLVNTALGKTFGLLEQGEGYRWGMKRAQGNVVHPIFNGFQLVMLYPWAAEAARRAKIMGLSRFYRLVPWYAGIGTFFCVSRGPHIALLLTMASIFFFRHPKLRIPLLIIGIAGVTAIVFGKDAVMHALGKLAGETEEDVRIIMIEGEPTEYTGTKHRILLLRVYAEAIEKAGLFGWGKSMKGIVLEESIAQRFGSIDSHYLMFYIQYGYVGIGLFWALMLTVIVYSIVAAWNAQGPWCTLAGGIAGSFLAVGLLMSSVWFAPDYGAVWLFNAGLISNILSLPKETASKLKDSTVEVLETAQRALPARRLIPVTQEAMG